MNAVNGSLKKITKLIKSFMNRAVSLDSDHVLHSLWKVENGANPMIRIESGLKAEFSTYEDLRMVMEHFNLGDLESVPKMDMKQMDNLEEKHEKRVDICFENIKHKLYRFHKGLRTENKAVAREFISEILLVPEEVPHGINQQPQDRMPQEII